ncbi:hypothetical protein C8R44DRAFT_882782 [Mycena epipterygia]|nr:hypothetical protein C8R44DRAFT_882782 [Mycena epipterygia]
MMHIFPPKFLPERDVPDLSGKIVLVTGGNTGIGYQTVKQFLSKNAKVYLAARSPEKGASAIKRLEEETKKSTVFLQLDLADSVSVRKAADEFLAQESRLDILFNNGGVMCRLRRCSPPRITTFIPALTKSYEKIKVPARVINTSSNGHEMVPRNGMNFPSLKGGPERDAWIKKTASVMGQTWGLYAESKLGTIFISNYWAKKYSDVLVSSAVHPGGIKTDLQQHLSLFCGVSLRFLTVHRNAAGWLQLISNVMSYPASMGAYTQLWGATVATPTQITGQYLIPWGKVGKADKRTLNTMLEDEVVAYIREQVKGF